MLERLEIRNFALIENLDIDFSESFNVITGETGAGKSIILGALNLLLGEKADPSVVRSDADECVVNAVFSVPEGHPAEESLAQMGLRLDDGALFVRRVVKAGGGRGLISMQGQNVSRTELAGIMDSLVDMHSQHEHQSLVHQDRQRRILDSYLHDEELLDAFRLEFEKRISLEKQLEDLHAGVEQARREQDYLKFALDEIRNVAPKPGEDEALKEEISALSHHEMLAESLNAAISDLSAAKGHAFDAQSAVSKAMKFDSALVGISARLESLRIESEDLYETIRDRAAGMSFSQERLDALQERLSRIRRLSKYGKTIDDIKSYADSIESMLRAAQNSEIELSKLDKRLKEQVALTATACDRLSRRRKEGAKALEKAIEAVLLHLGMPFARFCIEIRQTDMGSYGQDEIRFLISPNKGEEPGMISQIASGGELSRIMLAIKTVLAEADDTQTQVFDEVDAGIGGSVAQAVATQLENLSRRRQVIVITHLASIASAADCQLVVTKTSDGARTYSSIAHVTGAAREREIARMLSGDESDVSIAHAREMLGR